MAQTTITNLPPAISLTGNELVYIVQNGTSKRTTTAAIGQLAFTTNPVFGTLTASTLILTNPLAIQYGGTGQTTASGAFNALSPITATGDLIIGNGTNSATNLPIGAGGYVLTSNGTTASWQPTASTMVYPSAGIANSTGSAWGTSYSTTGTGTVVALQTAPTFVTSITSPVVYGGTSTSSSLTLQSTSGAGATDSIQFLVGNNGATTAMYINTSGNVGLGTTSVGSTALRLSTPINSSGSTAYGFLIDGAVQPAITATAYGASSLVALAASTTTNAAIHFQANPAAGGSGSALTSQYGFVAEATVGTQGGATVTNAYGFTGSIATGTNRWNLYMGGSATNYMAGGLGIGTTSLGGTGLTTATIWGGTAASSSLTLQSTSGTGASDTIVFKTGSGTTAMTINSSQNISVGTSGPSAGQSFVISKTMTGGSGTAFGFRSNGQIQTDVTTNAYYNQSNINIISGSFTIPNLYGYHVSVGTINVNPAPTVTTAFGFAVASGLKFAVTNYAFYANNPATSQATISNVALTSNVVTITTSANHNYGVGQTIIVAATTTTSVNGTFTITSIPSTTTFTYALVLADIPSTSDTGTVYQTGGTWAFYNANTAPSQLNGSLSIGQQNNTGGSAPSTTQGLVLRAGGFNYTDIISATGTVAAAPMSLFSATTLLARNTVTYTNAATVWIGGPPSASGTATITNAYSLYIGSGNSYFGGAATFNGYNVSIQGSLLSGTVNLSLSQTITGGTTAYGIYQNSAIQSGVTSSAFGMLSGINAAASAALGNVIYFDAEPQAGGATSSITTAIGFRATSNLTIAATTVTNAYGFQGTLTSAANVWNLYMSGSATNYMAGGLGIGTTSLGGTGLTTASHWGGTAASSTLTLLSTSGAGTTDSIQFKVASQTEVMRLDTTGALFRKMVANAVNATATLTVAQLQGGIITSTTAAAVTMTLPTGTVLDTAGTGLAATTLPTNATIQFTIKNTGATNAITVAVASGVTNGGASGDLTIAANATATYLLTKTTTNTFVLYKM